MASKFKLLGLVLDGLHLMVQFSLNVTLLSVSEFYIIHRPHRRDQCSYLYIMIDPLNWREPSFGLRKQPHRKLKQACQLGEEEKGRVEMLVINTGYVLMGFNK